MSNLKLYELSDQYQQLLRDMEEYEGDEETVENELLKRIDTINDATEIKNRNCAAWMLNLKYEYEMCNKAKKKLSERVSSLKKRHDKFKTYLKTNMSNMEINRITCSEFDILLAKPGNPKLDIFDEKVLPEDYKYYELQPIMKINKEKLESDLKAGVDVPGASLVPVRSLIIK